jgi:hypothetical protein
VQAATLAALAAVDVRQAVGGFIVLALRPDGQRRVWLDMDALLDLSLRSELLARIGAVPAFEVRDGPVVFALRVTLWGGRPPRRAAPVPPEWRAATAGQPPLPLDELLQRLWDEVPR